MSHSKKQWRQPEPAQLTCEQELGYALKALVLVGKHNGSKIDYSHVNREATAEHITLWLKQAQALGKGYAQQQLARLERSIAGNVLKGGIAQKLIDQARDLIDRALSWAKDLFASKVEQLGDDANEEDIEQALEDTAETVADTLALTEIQETVEQAVMGGLQDAGIAKIQAVNEPDACEICVENAEEGPIPLGSPFPSGHSSAPFHNRCRCHVEAV